MMKQYSRLLINEPPLQVSPTLAKLIGLNEAIVLQQVHYWIINPRNEGYIDEDNNKWVYNSYEQWREDNFPFWSVITIKRVFLSAEKKGVILSAQFKLKQRDMTKFYRVDYDQLDTLDGIKMIRSSVSKRAPVKDESETTSKTTTEKKHIYKKTKPKASDYPEVLLYHEVTGKYPTTALWDDVVKAVRAIQARTNKPAKCDELKPFYTGWLKRGWNEHSIIWLTDYAVKDIDPLTQKLMVKGVTHEEHSQENNTEDNAEGKVIARAALATRRQAAIHAQN